MLPPLGRLLPGAFARTVPVAPPLSIGFSFSVRFRNGLGRFSSSLKLYSGGGGDASMGIVADLLIVGAGAVVAVATREDDEARLEAGFVPVAASDVEGCAVR